MKKYSPKGFTLIELLVVISIISTMSSIVFAAVSSADMKGRDSGRISQINEVQNALNIYYTKNGHYPANKDSLTDDSNIPHNWSDMMSTLTLDNDITATFTKADTENPNYFSLIPVAYASAGTPYYKCSIQDPLYKVGTDYRNSYGYVASADQQSYTIRVHLEDPNSTYFSSSQDGIPFLGIGVTGSVTECSKGWQYYCTTSPK